MKSLWAWIYDFVISDNLEQGGLLFDTTSKQGKELISVIQFSVRLEVYCTLLLLACVQRVVVGITLARLHYHHV